MTDKFVFIVEDDYDLSGSMVEILVDDGHQVETAANGLEALTFLGTSKRNPCFVIVDYVMPVMNGKDFIAGLRQFRRFQFVPVLIITATDSSQMTWSGTIPVLYKPFSSRALQVLANHYCKCAEHKPILHPTAQHAAERYKNLGQ